MNLFKINYLFSILIVLAFINSGCKKQIFKPLTFSGKVINGYNAGAPAENCSVVLYKKKGSLLAKTEIFKDRKELCRAVTDGNGNFSMKLKWLDKRDNYYVVILYNNTPYQIYSNNGTFTNYTALDSYTEFKINF